MDTNFQESRDGKAEVNRQTNSVNVDKSISTKNVENDSNDKSSRLDSDVNTQQPTSKDGASLTNDEDFNVNPNDITNKPSFDNNKK